MTAESNDNLLQLGHGRQLHYASAGDPCATCVVLFFSGILSVGVASAASIPACFHTQKVHYIAPTIPGNGNSSSTPRGVQYNRNLCESITQLLEHLHPSDDTRKNAIQDLFLAGGSYGSVMCQMLYGAAFEEFPLGRRVRGMLLLAPFSPFREHTSYAQHLIWSNWISVGPPSQLVPFRILPWSLSCFVAWKCRNIEGARALLDHALFAKMDDREREQHRDYARKKRSMSGEDLKTEMAMNTLGCSKNWHGFVEVSDVLHSDWGYCLRSLDIEHSNDKRPVLVVHGEADPLGEGMATWLAGNYPYGQLKIIQGGHLAALYYLDDLWAQLLRMANWKQPEDSAITGTPRSDNAMAI